MGVGSAMLPPPTPHTSHTPTHLEVEVEEGCLGVELLPSLLPAQAGVHLRGGVVVQVSGRGGG